MSELSVRTSAVRGRLLRLPALTLVAAFVSAPLWAAPPNEQVGDAGAPTVANTSVASNEAQAVNTAGDQRGVLPDEGVPSRFEGTDLGRMLKRDVTLLKIDEMRSGAKMLDLAGGFRSVLVIHADAEGNPVMSCIVSEKEAERLLGPPPPLTKIDDGKEP